MSLRPGIGRHGKTRNWKERLMTTPQFTPWLWFDGQAEEAALE